MTKSLTTVSTTLLLIGGSFLILTIATWVAYILITSIIFSFMIYLVYKNNDIAFLVLNFCTEFIGFCLLIVLFVSTIVMMQGLIST